MTQSYAEAALRIEPHSTTAHVNLGVARERMGDFTGAIEQYERALQIDPNYIGAYENLAKLRLGQGEKIEQRKILEKLIELDPNNVIHLNNLSVLLMETGNREDDERANALLSKAFFLDQHDKFVLKNLGRLAFRYNQLNQALDFFEQAIFIAPEDVGLRELRVNLFNRMKRLDLALDECKELLRIDEENSFAYNELGVLYGKLGDQKSEENTYRKGLEKDANNPDLHNNLGVIFLNVHLQFAEAEKSFRKALELSSHKIYHVNLANSLARQNRCEEAEEQLAKYLQLGGTIDSPLYIEVRGYIDN
jgi:tetratricopeptide (TPR) repeat protein